MFPSLSLHQVTPIANAKVTWNAFSAAGAVGHKCLTAMVQATAEKTTAIECLSLAPPLIIWARNHTMSVKEIAVCIRLTFPSHSNKIWYFTNKYSSCEFLFFDSQMMMRTARAISCAFSLTSAVQVFQVAQGWPPTELITALFQLCSRATFLWLTRAMSWRIMAIFTRNAKATVVSVETFEWRSATFSWLSFYNCGSSDF